MAKRMYTQSVLKMYKRGRSLAQIALFTGISRETVRRILRDNKIPLRPRGRRKIT